MASTDRTLVVISRHWADASITLSVTEEKIQLSIPLQQFIESLCDEVGGVSLTFTEAGFRRQVRDACERVIAKVKEESARIV